MKNDTEGWVPLEVEYPGLETEYDVIERHPELSSPLLPVAAARGARLAHKLKLTYIAHHL